MYIILKNEQIRSINNRTVALKSFQGQIKVRFSLTPKNSHSWEPEDKYPLPDGENPVKIQQAVFREFCAKYLNKQTNKQK